MPAPGTAGRSPARGRRPRALVRVAVAVLGTVGILAAGATPAVAPVLAQQPPDPRPTAAPAQRPAGGPAAAPASTADVALPARSGSGRRVVYSVGRQRVWLVAADGRVTRTYLVSGRASQPGAGRYAVYSRSRYAASAVSAETMELMVRFARGTRTGAPIGFHTIPRHRDGTPAQSVADLGRPLSAGCVRQAWADAVALWRFAGVGTPVVVTP